MITISSNIGAVASSLTAKLKEFQGQIKDKVLRTVASDTLASVKVRIHQEGKNAADSEIGTYSSAYLKYREKKPFNRTDDTKIIFSLTRKMENEFVVIPTEKGYGLGWLDASGRTEPKPKPKTKRKKKSKPKKPSEPKAETEPKKESKPKKPLTNFEISQYLEERFGDVWKLTKTEQSVIKPIADRAVKEELVRLRLL